MKALSLSNTKAIIEQYSLKGKVIKCIPYGEGHINRTYLVTLKNQSKNTSCILQIMNKRVFPNIKTLMHNYVAVTKFLQKEISKNKGNPHRETINVIFTKDKQSFCKFNHEYCRVLEFIDHTVALQIIKQPQDFYQTALIFAKFYQLLDKFDASKLLETLPDFHNTQKRYIHFLKAIKSDKMKRAKTCQKEIKFIKDHAHYYPLITKMIKKHEIPLRVTHNDTKLNNVLFDIKKHLPVAVIDLDTIMPGSLCYDFGDAIRFGCNSAKEDEKQLSKVQFRFDLYQVFLKGFLKKLNKTLTKKEKENLALASIIMTIECGMRFLTDYLEGDHYFYTKYPRHNLIRCRVQLKLAEEMLKKYHAMNDLVKKY